MQRFYDDFVALKAKRKEDAEAVEGRFKAKIEANEKKAVAAAHAATIAAKKAKELEDAPALAAAAAQAARDAIAEVTDDDTDSTVKGTPTWAVATGAVAQPVSSVALSVTEKGKNPDGDAEPAGTSFALARSTEWFTTCFTASFAWCVCLCLYCLHRPGLPVDH